MTREVPYTDWGCIPDYFDDLHGLNAEGLELVQRGIVAKFDVPSLDRGMKS